MKTWEQHQFQKPVGSIRQKLSELLSDALPEYDIFPEDLIVQNPQYSSAMSDCCSWTAWIKKKADRNWQVHLHSWQTMGMIVKSKGVTLDHQGAFEIEVFTKAL